MTTLTVHLSESLKALAESRAAEAGFSDVGQFVAQLIAGEAAGAPEGLTIDSEAALEALLEPRANGPFLDMDASDFEQLRAKLKSRLSRTGEGRS